MNWNLIVRYGSIVLQSIGLAVALLATAQVMGDSGTAQNCAICNCAPAVACNNASNTTACAGCKCKTQFGQSTCYP